jgi:hypothetical protein
MTDKLQDKLRDGENWFVIAGHARPINEAAADRIDADSAEITRLNHRIDELKAALREISSLEAGHDSSCVMIAEDALKPTEVKDG